MKRKSKLILLISTTTLLLGAFQNFTQSSLNSAGERVVSGIKNEELEDCMTEKAQHDSILIPQPQNLQSPFQKKMLLEIKYYNDHTPARVTDSLGVVSDAQNINLKAGTITGLDTANAEKILRLTDNYLDTKNRLQRQKNPIKKEKLQIKLDELLGKLELFPKPQRNEALSIINNRSNTWSEIKEKSFRINVADINQDYYPDLIVNGKILLNIKDGMDRKFQDITQDTLNIEILPYNSIFVDLNKDGYPDIVSIKRVPGKNLLTVYYNKKNSWTRSATGKFESKINGDINYDNDLSAISYGDHDGDGDNDLILAFHRYLNGWHKNEIPILITNRYPKSTVFNKNDAGIIQSTQVATSANGTKNAAYYIRSIPWADLDGDRRPDYYFANYVMDRNILFLTKPDSSHPKVSNWFPGHQGDGKGNNQNYGHSIGASFGDLNNDGRLDLWVANLTHKDERGVTSDDSMILKNKGSTFRDMRACSGIRVKPVTTKGYETLEGEEDWGNVMLSDFDNDGFLDAYVTQVYTNQKSYIFKNVPRVYHNQGINKPGSIKFQNENYEIDGEFSFKDIGSGFSVSETYYGTWLDYNNDGKMDLLQAGIDGTNIFKMVLLKNISSYGALSNNYIKIHLKPDSEGKLPSIVGTQIKIKLNGDSVLVRQVEGINGAYNQQNDSALIFGLGQLPRSSIRKIQVAWTNQSEIQELDIRNLELNKSYTLKYGESVLDEVVLTD